MYRGTPRRGKGRGERGGGPGAAGGLGGGGGGEAGSSNGGQAEQRPRQKQTARRGRPWTGGARTGVLTTAESNESLPALERLVVVHDDGAELSPPSSDTETQSATVVNSDLDDDHDIPRVRPNVGRSAGDDAFARAYFGRDVALRPRTGPPLSVNAHIGGIMTEDPSRDPRLNAITPLGFSVSVHPLHLPNTRAMSAGSSASLIDFRFVRLAGLLHEMLPIRPNFDRVSLETAMGGGPMKVYGSVNVLFDALGYEFEMLCWVIDIAFPVEMLLGNDWFTKYGMAVSFGRTSITIERADARKTRAVQDVYHIR